MNNDLISRSALCGKQEEMYIHTDSGKIIPAMAIPVWVINNAPAIDAEPVRHGYWIQNKSVPDYHSCSDCHVTQKMRKVCGAYLLPKYCPNCGAKIDAEVSR